jgi:pimeloyl-ACP methyl ester carboxylesterase
MRIVGAHLGPGWRAHADPAWLEGWTPAPFEIEGGLTHVVEMGRGPTLVLLPPLPGYKEAWLACAAPLARSFRVVTFDLRARFHGPPRWEALLDDLSRVLDAVAPGPVALAGHSLGGALAQRWALAHPGRVRALALSSSFARVVTPRGDAWGRFVEQPLVLASQRFLPRNAALALARPLAARGAWVYDPRCDDAVLDFVRFCIRDVPLGVANNAVRLAFAHDTRAALGTLAGPTLVVVGERETAFARGAAEELERLIPGAERRESPGVAHLHLFSGAAWLARTLADWLGPRMRS